MEPRNTLAVEDGVVFGALSVGPVFLLVAAGAGVVLPAAFFAACWTLALEVSVTGSACSLALAKAGLTVVVSEPARMLDIVRTISAFTFPNQFPIKNDDE